MLEGIMPRRGPAASGKKGDHVGAEELELSALPFVNPQYLQSLNAFFRRRTSLQLRFAGRGLRVAPTWLADDPDIAEPYTIALKADSDQAELVVSEAVLSLMLHDLDPSLSLDALGPERTALITEFALSDALRALEQTIGCQLSIVAVGKGAGKWTGPDRPGLPLVLYLERIGIAWAMLRLSAGDIGRLSYFFDRAAGADRAGLDVPVSFCVRVAAVSLSVDEIASLEPGDILLVDDMVRQADGGIAVIGEHLVAPVEIGPSGYKLGSRSRRGRGSSWEWSLNQPALAQGRLENSGLGQLGVRVHFEMGNLEMDLADLQKLGPGSVVPLARPREDGLDIVANGHRIGRGKLVRIGESPGVRITRLFGRTEL